MSKRIRLLHAVEAGDVTWKRHARGRTFKLWHDDHNYTTVTRWFNDLIDDGEVECKDAGGYSVGAAPFGPVVLTRVGKQRIAGVSTNGAADD